VSTPKNALSIPSATCFSWAVSYNFVTLLTRRSSLPTWAAGFCRHGNRSEQGFGCLARRGMQATRSLAKGCASGMSPRALPRNLGKKTTYKWQDVSRFEPWQSSLTTKQIGIAFTPAHAKHGMIYDISRSIYQLDTFIIGGWELNAVKLCSLLNQARADWTNEPAAAPPPQRTSRRLTTPDSQ
jgi:transposase